MNSNECPRCGVRLNSEGFTSIEPVECPTCGFRLDLGRREPESGLELIQNYFRDVWSIISKPRAFFRQMPAQGSHSRPLAFALVTHWLGRALEFIWELIWGVSIFRYFQNFTKDIRFEESGYFGNFGGLGTAKDRILEWFTGVGPVIADPFLTIFSILFISFLVHLGVRVLTPSHKPSGAYETTLRIVCYGMTPSILLAVPVFGGFIAPLYALVVTIIGLQEVYQISLARSIIIALFPKLLIPGIIILGILIFLFSIIRLFLGFF